MKSFYRLWWVVLMGLWLCCAGVVQAAGPEVAMDSLKIVTASAVKMHVAPATNAPLVNRLKLGIVVRATRRTQNEEPVGMMRGYWYFVTAESTSGWVFGGLLRDFTPDKQEAIWVKLAKERSTNKNLQFADYADTYGFVSSILPKVKTKGPGIELEFNRLIVLQRSLDLINFENEKKVPFSRWLDLRKAEIFHDEISGRWLVPSAVYWRLADQVPNTPLGDEIARFASSAPQGGECEGDITCVLARSMMTEGEYLKRYPNGRFAADVIKEAGEVMTYVQQELRNQPNYFRQYGDASTGRVLQDYLKAVGSSKANGAAQLLGQLQDIEARYRAR